MIKFVDLHTGNTFDGHSPYVFWFDGPQSTGLNYIQKICVLSDEKNIVATIPEGIFWLLNVGNLSPDLSINYKAYQDLDKIKVHAYNSVGTPYGDYYVHMFYFLTNSGDAGEYQETFRLNDSSFEIGADFYNEHEELSINLANKGLSIPPSVQGAIYDSNVHEEGVDNALMNRKYKELLNEYIHVLDNRGSYKSLLNAVNWFEYGDLIKVLEYWKHEDIPEYVRYHGRDISQMITDKLQYLIESNQKTTYIGLYLATTRVKKNIYEEVVYDPYVKEYVDKLREQYGENWRLANTEKLILTTDDKLLQIGQGEVTIGDDFEAEIPGSNWDLIDKYFEEGELILKLVPEPIPSLESAAVKWSVVDLALKMTLVGNFFATYFMPLHLDLIHSTIEHIVYTNTIKVFSWNTLTRHDAVYDRNAFVCQLDGVYHLGNISTRVYPSTIFRQTELSYDTHIMGVDDEQVAWQPSADPHMQENLKLFFAQKFDAIGTIVPFNCRLYRISKDEKIQSGRIVITKDDQTYWFDSVIKDQSQDQPRHINFKLMFSEIGHYHVSVCFTSNYSKQYIQSFDFDVDDNIYQSVRAYRIIKKSKDTIDAEMKAMLNGTGVISTGLDKYAYSMVRHNNIIFKQFLAYSEEGIEHNISTSQVITYRHPGHPSTSGYLKINTGGSTFEIEGTPEQMVLELRQKFGDYTWFIQQRQEIDANILTQWLNGPDRNHHLIGLSQISTQSPQYIAQQWNLYMGSCVNGSRNIAYLYNIVKDLDFNKAGGSAYRDCLVNANYIVGICRRFDVNSKIELLNETNLGVAHGKDYNLDYLVVNLDATTLKLTCDFPKSKKFDVQILTTFGWQSYSQMDRMIYSTDHIIRGRVVFEDGTIKEWSCTIPELWDEPAGGLFQQRSGYGLKIKKISCYKNKVAHGRVWMRHIFIPAFYTVRELESDVVNHDDVVCFLPDITKMKGMLISGIGWRIYNATTGEDINMTPEHSASKPIPVEPMLGRYDYRLLVDPGYYDVELQYELVDNADHKHIYTSRSQFIMKS